MLGVPVVGVSQERFAIRPHGGVPETERVRRPGGLGLLGDPVARVAGVVPRLRLTVARRGGPRRHRPARRGLAELAQPIGRARPPVGVGRVGVRGPVHRAPAEKRIAVPPGLVELARRVRLPHRQNQERRESGQRRIEARSAPAVLEPEPGLPRDAEDRERQGPAIAIRLPLARRALGRARVERAQPGEDRSHVARPGRELDIGAVRGGRQLAQGLRLETRHDLGALVDQEPAVDRDPRAGFGADSDRVHLDPPLPRARDRRLHSPRLVLAVRQENHRLTPARSGAEGIERDADRVREIRAGIADPVGPHRAQIELERGVVAGQRNGERGLAREHHEPGLRGRKPAEELPHGELRAVEPRGRGVLGQHGSRDVEREYDVLADGRVGNGLDSPLRSGRRHAERGKADGEERTAHCRPPARELLRARANARFGERLEREPAATERPRDRERCDGHDEKRPQPLGPRPRDGVPAHGSLRNSVPRSTPSATTSPSARASTHA